MLINFSIQVFKQHSNYKVIISKVCSFRDQCLIVPVSYMYVHHRILVTSLGSASKYLPSVWTRRVLSHVNCWHLELQYIVAVCCLLHCCRETCSLSGERCWHLVTMESLAGRVPSEQLPRYETLLAGCGYL